MGLTSLPHPVADTTAPCPWSTAADATAAAAAASGAAVRGQGLNTSPWLRLLALTCSIHVPAGPGSQHPGGLPSHIDPHQGVLDLTRLVQVCRYERHHTLLVDMRPLPVSGRAVKLLVYGPAWLPLHSSAHSSDEQTTTDRQAHNSYSAHTQVAGPGPS